MINYELNLSMEELEKRTHKDYLVTKTMLKEDSPEYLNLEEGDKKALVHLVKAAYILEKINKQLDNEHNLPFEEFLNEEIKKGNKRAELTKILYDAQKGVCALDRESNIIELAKGVHSTAGKGVYPEDLGKEEFQGIILKMLKSGKIDEVKTILNQRSVVERCGEELHAIDYIDKYKEDFSRMADELELASKVSTNADFNEYLELQAKALRTADSMLDAYADKKWATLQDTPLEFTITRENYSDELTESVIENNELKDLLEKYNITPIGKDFLGGRVGIVNKKGTEAILKVKEFLPIMADNMPFKDEYVQNISPDKESKQTMVDVDLVTVSGDVGEFRAGITLAENLPNDDKLSLTIGGGRRNVYHRQIRLITSEDSKKKLQERLDAILNKEQHKYYNDEADHWFTIGHENGHSLGPDSSYQTALGVYQHIIEEHKANLISASMMPEYVKAGIISAEQLKKIYATWVIKRHLMTAYPSSGEAHRVADLIEYNYLTAHNAIYFDKNKKLHIDFAKMPQVCRAMLEDIISIQLSKSPEYAKAYIEKWTDWSEISQYVADFKLKLGVKPYIELVTHF